MKTISLIEFSKSSRISVNFSMQNRKKFVFSITGGIENIDFPKIRAIPSRKNELWTIGCFEIFVQNEENSYTEYNFGFSRDYECFNFTNYRENQTRCELSFSPEIHCTQNLNEFILEVQVADDIIKDKLFSVAAVIKIKGGNFLYFSNKHCGDKPDFHLAAARILNF